MRRWNAEGSRRKITGWVNGTSPSGRLVLNPFSTAASSLQPTEGGLRRFSFSVFCCGFFCPSNGRLVGRGAGDLFKFGSVFCYNDEMLGTVVRKGGWNCLHTFFRIILFFILLIIIVIKIVPLTKTKCMYINKRRDSDGIYQVYAPDSNLTQQKITHIYLEASK